MKRLNPSAVAGAYLALCVLLGGSSIDHAGNLVLQLLAIAILFWALAARRTIEIPSAGRELLALVLLLLLLLAIQIVPLPPSLWSQLPGREQVAEAYSLLQQRQPWLPISLAPFQTVVSSIWLLPPLAILISFLRLGVYPSKWIAWVLVGVSTASVLLGTAQIIGGSAWYPYEITNDGAMTGFFANSNHFATLLLVTTPFVAALYAKARGRGAGRQNQAGAAIMFAASALFILVGIVVTNSLAGLALMVPVAAASLMMIRFKRRQVPGWCWLLLAAAGTASAATVLAAPFGNDLMQAKADAQPITRSAAWPRTLQAAADFAPMGSGIGTFVAVYPRYEDPGMVDQTYMNHAHNDYLELALETGLPGLALLGAFLWWWGRRAFALWTSSGDGDLYARAASIASAAILIHSSVDYPVRMTAISVLLALCCGMMSVAAPERAKTARKERRPPQGLVHLGAD